MKTITQQICQKIMKGLVPVGFCAMATAALTSAHAQSTNLIDFQILDASISIQYNGNPPNPLPTMTGAAEIGLPGDVWNTAPASLLSYSAYPSGMTTTSPIPLNYADGTPSGVSVALSAPSGTYNANSFGNYSPFTRAGSPYSALMQTLMVVGKGQSGSVTLTGLTPGQGYDLYVYTAGDQNVAGGRQGQYTVDGNGEYYIWDGATTNLVEGVTYLEFLGVAPDATGKLVITLGDASAETDMNGFQLVPAAAGPSPSMINNLSPNGSRFFNDTNTFTFNIQSASTGGAQLPTNPQSGVGVIVNGQNETSLLQFSGSNTFWNVSLPGVLTSNSVYTVGIVVTNSAGLFSSNSVTFDTYAPAIVVPAETYDFNGGSFIQSFIPTNAAGPTSYFGVTGVSNVDYSMVPGSGVTGGGTTLAPNYPDRGDSNVAFQVASDLNLPLYQAQSNSAIYNVNIAYNNAGNWFNYTRNPWPQGNYIVYARVSSGNGTPGGIGNYEALNLVTSGYGTATQTTNNLGYFVIADGLNWGTYYWVPLTDGKGNLVPVNIPGGQQTLQLLSGGGLNVIDFMFIAVPPQGLPPAINNFSPALTSGGNAFVGNSITFSVSSLFNTIATSNIHVLLNGSPVTPMFSGSDTDWTVTFPVSGANQFYTFAISAVDSNGLTNSVSGTFDTFSQTNFMIEAGDFDFNDGQSINNPIETATTVAAANSYYGYPEAGDGEADYLVDYSTTNVTTAETYLYRFDGDTPGSVSVVSQAAGTEVTSDFLRDKFINEGSGAQPPFEYVPGEPVPTTNTDYDLAWWPPGTWLNYTRTFPANTYRIWGRLASGAVYTNATMSLVTSGQGTPSQTTQLLGTFSDTNASGFQAWHWVPLLNNNGQPVVVSLGGVETLKLTAPPGSATGSLNSHFYMFVPFAVASSFHISVTASTGTASIHFPTQSGHSYTVQYSTSLNPANWQTVSGGNGITGDGTDHTVNDSMTAGPRFYRVQAQ
jgi:hypothetical protein